MTRLIALLVLALTVFGVAAFAITTERTSAQQLPQANSRFDLDCQQIFSPNDPETPDGVGVVRCQLTIQIPHKWVKLLGLSTDELKLTIFGAYRDVDGNKRPSHGDRLLCIRVVGPNNFLFERCRPGIEVPPDLSLPGS